MITHCSSCHRILTDPVSMAMGIGPECRKNGDKRRAARVGRSLAFNDHQPISFNISHGSQGRSVVRYEWTGTDWSDGRTKMTEADFMKWLQRYGLVDKETLRQGSHPA